MTLRLLIGLTFSLGAAAATSGCLPLPIPNTREVTPALTGRLQREDGTPMAGVSVAVAPFGSNATCSNAAERGVTDSLGRFALPRGVQHSSWYLFTMMESFGRAWYSICTAEPGDTTLHYRGDVRGMAESDVLECFEWRFDDRARMSCNTLADRPVLSGGQWTSGPSTGTYRIILAGDTIRPWLSFGFIQWIAVDSTTGARLVRATTWLPSAAREQFDSKPGFISQEGQWYLIGPKWNDRPFARARMIRFALGGPGELWRLPP